MICTSSKKKRRMYSVAKVEGIQVFDIYYPKKVMERKIMMNSGVVQRLAKIERLWRKLEWKK